MTPLQALRSLWIAAARELVDAFVEATPPRELGGILGRAGDLLETLAEGLDAFEEVILAGPDSDPEAVEEVLLAARRIPRCVLAFSSELERAEEDRAWVGLQERAALLRSALRGFHHVILLGQLGMDLAPSLPEPRLAALAHLGRAARLEQLAPLLRSAPQGDSVIELDDEGLPDVEEDLPEAEPPEA